MTYDCYKITNIKGIWMTQIIPHYLNSIGKLTCDIIAHLQYDHCSRDKIAGRLPGNTPIEIYFKRFQNPSQ